MTVDLARDVEEFLQEQLKAGLCSSPSELVNDLVRSVREQRQKSFDITPQLEAWLLESSTSPVTALSREDFDAIRQRVRARGQQTGS